MADFFFFKTFLIIIYVECFEMYILFLFIQNINRDVGDDW